VSLRRIHTDLGASRLSLTIWLNMKRGAARLATATGYRDSGIPSSRKVPNDTNCFNHPGKM